MFDYRRVMGDINQFWVWWPKWGTNLFNHPILQSMMRHNSMVTQKGTPVLLWFSLCYMLCNATFKRPHNKWSLMLGNHKAPLKVISGFVQIPLLGQSLVDAHVTHKKRALSDSTNVGGTFSTTSRKTKIDGSCPVGIGCWLFLRFQHDSFSPKHWTTKSYGFVQKWGRPSSKHLHSYGNHGPFSSRIYLLIWQFLKWTTDDSPVDWFPRIFRQNHMEMTRGSSSPRYVYPDFWSGTANILEYRSSKHSFQLNRNYQDGHILKS
jgi:hypothetical protein